MIKQVVYLFMRYLFNQISFRTRIHFKLKIKLKLNDKKRTITLVSGESKVRYLNLVLEIHFD